MQHSTLVIIPARNEQPSVADVVTAVRTASGCTVLVVDDDSEDATAKQAREAGALVISLPLNLGAWGAMQAGMLYALENGYTHCVTMDADGQHPAEALHALLAPVYAGEADTVIGSCVQRGSRLRKVAWRFFRTVTGLGIRDLTSGFRAYNREAMRLLVEERAALLDYQDIGVLFLLKHAGFTVHEIPVEMQCRLNGASRIFNTWFAVSEYMVLSSVLAFSKNLHSRRTSRAT